MKAASVAYTAVRQWEILNGDSGLVAWESLSDSHQEFYNRLAMAAKNRGVDNVRDMHNLWVSAMMCDIAVSKYPEFDELSEHEKTGRALFLAIIRALP